MKRSYISILVTALLTLLSSCDDKLDITPRGFSVLNSVDDVGAMLNREWRVYLGNDYEHEIITGNTFAYWSSPSEVFGKKNTVNYAFIFGDEDVDRVALCNSDTRYSEIYENIQYCNIVISKMPEMNGDNAKKQRFIAQARILRAWFHFIAVNFFAAQYDEATASVAGGIAYVEDIDFGAQKTKLTVAQVYDKILADCSDDLISCLDTTPTDDPFRFEADFGYAVRARVLFQMKRYKDAAEYARKAIAVNPVIEDRSTILNNRTWECAFDSPNNYMFILSNFMTNSSELDYKILTPEFMALYEDGDYVRYYTDADEWINCEDYNIGTKGSMICDLSGTPRINVWGIRSEQMYYVLAESLIRTGFVDDGLDNVDKVRKYRIHPDKFTAFKGSVSTEREAMALLKRAKTVEFILSIENYLDCKRRNSEPEYAADIVHHIDDLGDFTIKANSPLWINPFPMNATDYNPSLTQNF